MSGRKLNISISGTNTDFTTAVLVTINGTSNGSPLTEVLSFSDYDVKETLNNFNFVDSVEIVVKPVNISKNALSLNIKESESVTKADGLLDGYADGYTTPVIKYSYYMGGNYSMKKDGSDTVRDENSVFSDLHIGNYLWITEPVNVVGFYLITDVSDDRKSLTITPTNAAASLPLPSFVDATYKILNTSVYRSGLQNGFFTFEQAISPGEPYFLNKGFYEIEYKTYASIKFDPVNDYMYFGSNFEGLRQANMILDEVKIYSNMLTDTRVGETIPNIQKSITKNYNSLKAIKSDQNTLVNLSFDIFPFVNDVKVYVNKADKSYNTSSIVVNDNFTNSIAILDKPIIIENEVILDTKKEGTVEFWINPIYDTANDPNVRYYFDAYGATIEETVSVNNTAVKISAPASQILSVKVKNSDIDYFAGGTLEIDTQNAIQEEGMSISANSLIVSKPILQVISVKIEDDLTNTDYFAGGLVGTDFRTIYLGKSLPSNNLSLITTYQTTENKKITQNSQIIRLNKKLPYQNTTVTVQYIPKGLQGDRVSIFKDTFGYINFGITASGIDYVVRAPTRWSHDTWHRIKASYKVNSGTNNDEMRLFIDGYEFNNVSFGSGIIFGEQPFVIGSSMPGDGYTLNGNINFKDQINNLFIGTAYNKTSPIFSLIDNFRISNIFRPIYSPYAEPLDVNYSSNLDTVFPVTEDLYTTYLLDFNKLVELTDDFAQLKNRKNGLFDFSINIFDNLDILNNNAKVKEVLEKLIRVLKPANSRVFIKYG